MSKLSLDDPPEGLVNLYKEIQEQERSVKSNTLIDLWTQVGTPVYEVLRTRLTREVIHKAKK